MLINEPRGRGIETYPSSSKEIYLEKGKKERGGGKKGVKERMKMNERNEMMERKGLRKGWRLGNERRLKKGRR